MLIITIATPLILLAAVLGCARGFHMTASATKIRMLAGVWLLGGAFMLIGASFAGGRFSGADGFRSALIFLAMSWPPMYTYIMDIRREPTCPVAGQSVPAVHVGFRSEFATTRSQQ